MPEPQKQKGKRRKKRNERRKAHSKLKRKDSINRRQAKRTEWQFKKNKRFRSSHGYSVSLELNRGYVSASKVHQRKPGRTQLGSMGHGHFFSFCCLTQRHISCGLEVVLGAKGKGKGTYVAGANNVMSLSATQICRQRSFVSTTPNKPKINCFVFVHRSIFPVLLCLLDAVANKKCLLLLILRCSLSSKEILQQDRRQIPATLF